MIVDVEKMGAEEVSDTRVDLKQGTYVLVFDNSYSMMTSKQLSYCVDSGAALEGADKA